LTSKSINRGASDDSFVPTLRVLGIDPGSDTTGYGVVESEGGRCRLIEYSAIHTTARLPFAERLVLISECIEEVIQRLEPNACSVEESFYAVNVKSALKLGRVLGAVTVTASRAGVPVFEYSPLEIKSALVGYGRAEKRQVQEMVRLILSLEQPPQPLDASDALAAAICHIHIASTKHKMRQPLDLSIRSRRGAAR
jgi:crossover junction endodeoxyribonuclease RuvC